MLAALMAVHRVGAGRARKLLPTLELASLFSPTLQSALSTSCRRDKVDADKVKERQGSILQNSIRTENFADKFSPSNVWTDFRSKICNLYSFILA
jgi:hypothetical protein